MLTRRNLRSCAPVRHPVIQGCAARQPLYLRAWMISQPVLGNMTLMQVLAAILSAAKKTRSMKHGPYRDNNESHALGNYWSSWQLAAPGMA